MMSANEETLKRSARSRRQPKIGGMDRGQPSPIDQPFDLRADGTTRTVADALLDDLRAGLSIETATHRVGLAYGVVRNWVQTAGKATIRLTADPTTNLTTNEQKCRKFSADVDAAIAEFKRTENARLNAAEQGGQTIRVVRSRRKFRGPTDTEGYEVDRTTELRTLPPDPRVTMWRLERRFPAEFGQKIAISVEEPVLSDEETATTLVDELNSFLSSRDDAPAVEAETPETKPANEAAP